MLEDLRENLKKYGLIIAAIICIPFVLTGADFLFVGSSSTQTAVVVNGESIDELSIQRAVAQQKQQLQNQYGPEVLQQVTDEMLRGQVLNMLVQKEIMVQAAQERGMGVAKKEIDSLIRKMPAFAQDGIFSNEQYQLTLRRIGYTPKSFAQDMREDFVVSQFSSGLIASGFTSQVELGQTTAVTEQQRDFYYLTIPVESLVEAVEVEEAAIEQRYNLTLQDYTIPEQIEVEYVELTVAALLTEQQITDDLIQAQFDAEIAVLVEGVELPVIDDQRSRIEQELRTELAEKQYLATLEELKDSVFDAETLQQPAEALGLELKISQPFSRAGGEGLTANAQIVAAAFGDDVLINGYSSEVIELSDTRSAVVKLRERIPEHIKSLDEVKGEVEKALALEFAGAKAITKGQEYKARLAEGELIMDLAKTALLEWQVSLSTRLTGGNVADDIRRLAFSLPTPIAQPIVEGFSRANGDYVLLSLTAVQYGNSDSTTTEQASALKQGLDVNNSQKTVQAYQGWLVQQADIDVGS